MSAPTPGPAADLIEHAARVILASKKQPHTAPYHWAGALYQAGMLVAPGTAGPTPDILHTGRADIHHHKGPLTGRAGRSGCAEGCAWASHMRGGEPLYVQICMLCERINWEDLAEQVDRVRAAALHDFAASMRTLAEQAPEGEPAGWPWTAYALAAVKAEERAAAPAERVRDGSTDTTGTPGRPNPLDYCCEPLGCGHHINGHNHGSHCTHPGCGCRVWRDHVNCDHRPDTDRTPGVGTPDPQQYWWRHSVTLGVEPCGPVAADWHAPDQCPGCGRGGGLLWMREEPAAVPSLPEETPAGGIE